jgi:hypothetical protein
MTKKILAFMCGLCTGLGVLFASQFLPSKAYPKNYNPTVCTEEPNPEECQKIVDWYQKAILPKGQGDSSCCGLGDAYWFEIDNIDQRGVWATIRDNRDINGRKMRDGEKIFIPPERLDNRFQGNPTGHSVVFLGQPGALFPNGTDQPGYAWIYCAFPDLPG